jgi:hypothetical protein
LVFAPMEEERLVLIALSGFIAEAEAGGNLVL